MEIVSFLIDFILHVDKHLEAFVANYGAWVYALLFLIVFVETGVVVMPFLPGDSLLFIVGALRQLLADENFTNLLRAEGLDTLPQYLADRVWARGSGA